MLVCALIAGLGASVAAHHRVEKGRAVYYSDAYAGQTMACGGAYQPDKMVAAHRTLACGTKVKVKNRSNGEAVKVRIKDRGPYGDEGIIIDVSKKAARKLDFITAGSAKVKVVVLHD